MPPVFDRIQVAIGRVHANRPEDQSGETPLASRTDPRQRINTILWRGAIELFATAASTPAGIGRLSIGEKPFAAIALGAMGYGLGLPSSGSGHTSKRRKPHGATLLPESLLLRGNNGLFADCDRVEGRVASCRWAGAGLDSCATDIVRFKFRFRDPSE